MDFSNITVNKQSSIRIAGSKIKTVIPTHYGNLVGSPADGADFKELIAVVDREIRVELKL